MRDEREGARHERFNLFERFQASLRAGTAPMAVKRNNVSSVEMCVRLSEDEAGGEASEFGQRKPIVGGIWRGWRRIA